MSKAVLVVSPKKPEDKLQEVGYRVALMEKILNSGLEGLVENFEKDKVKVILKGEKEKIEAFVEELKTVKPPLFPQTPNFALEFDDSLPEPDTLRASQALSLNQVTKGTVFLASMDKKLDTLPEKIGERLDDLPERIAQAIKNAIKPIIS